MGDDQIRFTRSRDGLHLAYEVRGEGPLVVLELGGHGVLFPFDAADEQPRWRRFEERLRRFARVVRFDLRGIGYSDQFSATPTIADWAADALAVLDAAQVDRAVLMAASFGGLAAMHLAAEHPERVTSLVLANTGARFSWAEDYPVGARPEVVDGLQSGLDPTEVVESDNDIELLAPSLAGDADVRQWWTRTARRGASPASARGVWDASLAADVRDLLPSLHLPTMVMVTTGNQFLRPAMGRYLADRLPDADLREIDAPDHVIWAVPDDLVVDQIEQFLTGALTPGRGRRSLRAVLFTDIVASTAHNTEQGDRAWLERLARHDELAALEIRRRGGRVVKHLGDGLLAVFPLASDAIETALTLTAAAVDLGIAVRAGLHVAEVEDVGDDVLGLGVTIAARVVAEARAGEVLATAIAAGVLAGSSTTFESRGRHRLKGVAGEWELSAVRRAG